MKETIDESSIFPRYDFDGNLISEDKYIELYILVTFFRKRVSLQRQKEPTLWMVWAS